MDINIRWGEINDVPFIRKLLEENLENFISPLRNYSKKEIENLRNTFCEGLKKRIEEEELIAFIAEDRENGKPLGFFLLEYNSNPFTEEIELYITNIAVEKNVMGKFISNKLGLKIHEYAEEIGIPVITADITEANRRSMLFATRYFKYRPEAFDYVKILE